ncbi:MAG: DUF4870 domain-containing protein [Wenzhouxiangellaceae bacterium]
MASASGLSQPVAGILCYVLGWISGLIMLLIEPRDRFIRFHAAQSIVTFGLITLLGIVLPEIPVLGGLLYVLTAAVSFILWLLLMITAGQGKTIELPLIADIAKTLAK